MEKGKGFKNDKEKARTMGMGPEAMKQDLLRQQARKRREDAFERAHGRSMTPEERVAGDLKDGALRHDVDGNVEQAAKNRGVASRLLSGDLDVEGAFTELGSTTEPE